MSNDKDIESQIRELEEQLLTPAVRSSAEQLSELLADEFREHGSSGRSYDKASIIEALDLETSRLDYAVEEFAVRLLSADTLLATYQLSIHGEKPRASLRCSIWIRRDDRWQLFFHQGTRIS